MVAALDYTLEQVIAVSYVKVTSECWGGATIQLSTNQFVPDGIDAYALTVKENGQKTIEIPASADFSFFSAAFLDAMLAFSDAEYLGIFYDYLKGVIEFDPVIVVKTKAEVNELSKRYPVTGGAYHFLTGKGYWPDRKD